MWLRYEPYCPDAHFLSDARCNFFERWWEMYVACTLLDAGFKLERPPPKGPDILTRVNGTRLWIEAVAPGAGKGADAVPDRDRRGSRRASGWIGHAPSQESLILRCASVLVTKRAKLAEYVAERIVAPEDAVVIAVTLGGVRDAIVSSPELPIMVKAVFGRGKFFVAVSVDGSGIVETGFKYQPEIRKKSGAAVSTTFFLEEESQKISGILFTNEDFWNAPKALGKDLVFVHNPSATVPLPVGVFPFANEYFVDGEGKLGMKERTLPGPS